MQSYVDFVTWREFEGGLIGLTCTKNCTSEDDTLTPKSPS